MNSILIIKIVVFILALIISRIIFRRIPKMLNERQLETLAENSKKITLLRNVLIYGTAILFFILPRVAPEQFETAKIILLTILSVGMFLVVILSYRKFNELGLPPKARNTYVLSVVVFIVGVIFLLLPLG